MLDRYESILNGEIEPYYIQAKGKGGNQLSEIERIDRLWSELESMNSKGEVPPLSLKSELSQNLLEECILCERKCRVDRKKGEDGYCKVTEPKISSEFLHMGEERELVPSHTVFFVGCNLGCIFCQNYEISQLNQGRYIPPETLSDKIESGNGKNINWVGGDPTPNLPYIIEVLEELNKFVPLIWNSNMYMSEESMRLLERLMDVYLTDFKYGNDECAEKLSDVKDYTSVVKRNHIMAEETGDLIIRHLVLPGHLDCCTEPLLEWVDENLEDPRLNIMTQYRPVWKAEEYPEINRYLNKEEKRRIKSLRKEYSNLVATR